MRDRSGMQAGPEDWTFWCHKTLSPGEVVNHIIKNKKRKHLPCPGRRTCHVLHTMSYRVQMASKNQLLLQKELQFCFNEGWGRQWHPTPVPLPGKSHGWRSLVGCSPFGRWGSDTTEQLHFHFSLSWIGEGNGNPLQCSCLENPRDGGAWWAATSGVTESDTTEVT